MRRNTAKYLALRQAFCESPASLVFCCNHNGKQGRMGMVCLGQVSVWFPRCQSAFPWLVLRGTEGNFLSPWATKLDFSNHSCPQPSPLSHKEAHLRWEKMTPTQPREKKWRSRSRVWEPGTAVCPATHVLKGGLPPHLFFQVPPSQQTALFLQLQLDFRPLPAKDSWLTCPEAGWGEAVKDPVGWLCGWDGPCLAPAWQRLASFPVKQLSHLGSPQRGTDKVNGGHWCHGQMPTPIATSQILWVSCGHARSHVLSGRWASRNDCMAFCPAWDPLHPWWVRVRARVVWAESHGGFDRWRNVQGLGDTHGTPTPSPHHVLPWVPRAVPSISLFRCHSTNSEQMLRARRCARDNTTTTSKMKLMF